MERITAKVLEGVEDSDNISYRSSVPDRRARRSFGPDGRHKRSSRPTVSVFRCYLDGSCPTNNKPVSQRGGAGWGFAVSLGSQHYVDSFGPVILDPNSPWFIGAESASNNSGEFFGYV